MSRAQLGAAIVAVGILAWAWLHRKLLDKEIAISESRMMMLEIIPAFVFSGMVVTFLYPATYNLVYGRIPEFAPQGYFWDMATFLGALTMTVGGVAWIGLIPDKESDSQQTATEDAVEATDAE